MARASQYSDSTCDEMQLVYGEGYLSPGGAEEVDAMLEGFTVRGRRVLDLGCGVGGAAIRIVRELGAGAVVGIDVEERALERAAVAVEAAGLARRITFEPVAPGPFPFPDESVDIVFCKDVISHLADKAPLFSPDPHVALKHGFGDEIEACDLRRIGCVRRRPDCGQKRSGAQARLPDGHGVSVPDSLPYASPVVLRVDEESFGARRQHADAKALECRVTDVVG